MTFHYHDHGTKLTLIAYCHQRLLDTLTQNDCFQNLIPPRENAHMRLIWHIIGVQSQYLAHLWSLLTPILPPKMQLFATHVWRLKADRLVIAGWYPQKHVAPSIQTL